MRVLKVYPNSINQRFIGQAVETLHDGEVIICPTDTLYSFACDALNRRAIERLCRIKNINPDKNLLSIVCASISQAAEYARIDNNAFRILKQYLPGPYTFILPASTKLPKEFKGRKTVGIRVPDNPIAIALSEALGSPLLTSSVVVDDADPENSANPEALALAYSADVNLIIDGGDGLTEPSTIVDLTDSAFPEIIRQGIGKFE